MKHLSIHGQYYELLSNGSTPPKKMRAALNKEGDANWKRLLEEIKTPDLLEHVN